MVTLLFLQPQEKKHQEASRMLECKLGIVFNNNINFIVFGGFDVCVEGSVL